jgi:PleD family two-component response regulator
MARILVIDDSKLILHVAKTILSKQGHQVLLAEDGNIGLRTAATEHPDLILLDLILPGMDGYEVCQRIKKGDATSEIPVIMLLTGLYNHRYFKETILNDFQRAVRYHESLSCVMFDIDHFKKFNDNYGHQAGDMVLRTLGSLIDNLVRGSDLPARYGGEEFVLLMYHTAPKEALMVAERLRKAVEQF